MKYKETILIVDDIKTNIDILVELLSNEYDIIVATDGQSALEIISEEQPDLILLDIMMPGMDGYKVCSTIKANDKTMKTPIIFITAKTDGDSIEKAYNAGGDDYITKPFKPKELRVRIKTQLKIKNLIKHLEYIASHDQMTGVYNRRKFFELANKKFLEAPQNLYAIIIDIDKFKNINDTYGHYIGDKVIKLVSKTIKEHIDKNTIFGRIGGEEFAILCNASSKEEVIKKIEYIRNTIQNLEILTEDNQVVKCTISEGIAKVTKDTNTLDLLLKEADVALYEAKGSGRNKVIFR